jgi:serine O-acetyltransferase
MLRSTLARVTVITAGARRFPGQQSVAREELWSQMRNEAAEAYERAPVLGRLFVDSILDQPSLEAAAFYRIAFRLKNDVLSLAALIAAFDRALSAEADLGETLLADIGAVMERDPACERFIEPFLYFKGFHAIQTHRLAHWLWGNGERDFALYLQSRSSDVFQTDIHPAARFGRGIFLDHATGLVVGETAEIGDDVSLLQNVTLGGTGKETGNRHPKIRQGVMIGAGAKILGNIEIGSYARIAAGSVVLRSVEPYATVAGVPARVIKTDTQRDPSRRLDQLLCDLSNEALDYSI